MVSGTTVGWNEKPGPAVRCGGGSTTASSFEHALAPLASPEDSVATMQAVQPHVEATGGDVTVVTVVEKAGGASDETSVDEREDHAQETFGVARGAMADSDLTPTTEIRHGTDVAEAVVETARDVDASAVVFTPHDGSRWIRLPTGDGAPSLVSESDLPVFTLPEPNHA